MSIILAYIILIIYYIVKLKIMSIIYANMVGDLFHSGHVKFLSRISTLADFIIIGVTSDEDVNSYKRIPIITLEDRVSVIESCLYVNKVVAACPLVITEEFLDKHKIDLVVHAHDLNDTSYDFIYKVPMELGKFRRIDYTHGISTTEIIQRCKHHNS
jgi:cytidyltransferase-like protein